MDILLECAVCGNHVENALHLFFAYPVVMQVWSDPIVEFSILPNSPID